MLTEKQIKAFKPAEKTKKYFDAHGLYVEVTTKGKKYWRYKYRYQGKEKRISLGVYPETPLKEARSKRQDACDILNEGYDPATRYSKGKKVGIKTFSASSFLSVAEEWHKINVETWSVRHAKITKQRLEKNIYPYFGQTPINEIKPIDVLTALKAIEARGANDVAHKTYGICSMIFNYAVASCYVESNPCRDLKGALAPIKKGKFAAITNPKEIGPLMRAIYNYEHSMLIKFATLLSAYTFCRPVEIRTAEWSEIDFDNALWIIPSHKMKAKREHVVPLSQQSKALLKEMYKVTSYSSKFVFPSVRTNSRPISDGSVNAALRYLGYSKTQMCAHGFRAMASTRLYEMNKYRPDVIEKQLAHEERNKVKAAYNRAEYLEERIAMMQDWADYLDTQAETI